MQDEIVKITFVKELLEEQKIAKNYYTYAKYYTNVIYQPHKRQLCNYSNDGFDCLASIYIHCV